MGGSDLSCLNLAFLGDGKSGRPKNAKFNHDRSDPPFAAL